MAFEFAKYVGIFGQWLIGIIEVPIGFYAIWGLLVGYSARAEQNYTNSVNMRIYAGAVKALEAQGYSAADLVRQ